MNNQPKPKLVSSFLILAMALAACSEPTMRPTSTPKPDRLQCKLPARNGGWASHCASRCPQRVGAGYAGIHRHRHRLYAELCQCRQPGRYTIKLHNTGAIPHDMTLSPMAPRSSPKRGDATSRCDDRRRGREVHLLGARPQGGGHGRHDLGGRQGRGKHRGGGWRTWRPGGGV